MVNMQLEVNEFQIHKLIELAKLIPKSDGWQSTRCDIGTALSKALEEAVDRRTE